VSQKKHPLSRFAGRHFFSLPLFFLLTRRHVRRRRPHPRRRVVRRPRRRNRDDARRHDARLLPQLAGSGDERVFVGVDAALSGEGGGGKGARLLRHADPHRAGCSSPPLPSPPCARALPPLPPPWGRGHGQLAPSHSGGRGRGPGHRGEKPCKAREHRTSFSMAPLPLSPPPSPLLPCPSHLRHLPRALLVVDPPV